MGNLLETNALTKTFKGQAAVDHVSLHVPEGSVYGLLGPNGAGKSTLLKMVCGMLRPTSGSIAFAGRPWTRADLDGIGALIETPPLYDNLTARENLRVRTTLLGIPDERIDEVLRTVGLTDTGSKRAGRFSMGMKQRLGIALALLAPTAAHPGRADQRARPHRHRGSARVHPRIAGAGHHGGGVEPHPGRSGAGGGSHRHHRTGKAGLRGQA